MSLAINEVANSTSRTARIADEARGDAMTGKKLVMDVVESIHRIETQSVPMHENLRGCPR